MRAHYPHMTARVRGNDSVFWLFVALAMHLGVTVEELGDMGLRAAQRKARS